MVTVIIPTYGTPTYLKKSIESVINQTFGNWELIIVDDNNPNTEERKQTERIIYTYQDNRIKYIRHPHNKNGAAARNTALRQAKGKYISFLDSDDEYMPKRLEECVKNIEEAGDEVAGVYTGCEFRSGGKPYLRYSKVKSGNFKVDTLACRFMFCTGSNIFVRKSVMDELNGFDENFLRHQDYEFLVRLFEKYSLNAISEILVVKNNENINLPNIDKLIAVKKQYLEKFREQIGRLSKDEQSYVFSANYISLAEHCLRQHDFIRGNSFYRLAKENSPLTLKDNMRKIILALRAFLAK